MAFDNLQLHPLILKAIHDAGYDQPTPIQKQAIPIVLANKDLLAAAQTGTGKTAAFTLPILHKLNTNKPAKPNQAKALIVTPTRELAAQIADNIILYSQHLSLTSAVVFGGVKINPQMKLLRKGIDILVATPGRLLDLHQQNAIKFDHLEILVLDEADRMLDMGFIHDIKRILKILPKKRQNLLFSATFSDEIRTLAKTLTNQAEEVSVTPRNSTVAKITQWLAPVDKKRKSALLINLLEQQQWQQVLVFCRTKHGANRLIKQLNGADIPALAIHGNKSQGARTKALAEFKAGKIRILVATDIAARGIDINELPNVVNFDLPNVPEDYVHRIGRTGRAGSKGEAVSLVCADEMKQLTDIERLIQKLIPREYIDGFEPQHELPESRLLPPKKKTSKKSNKPEFSQQANNTDKQSSSKHTSRSNSNKKHHQSKNSNKSSDTKNKKFNPWNKKSNKTTSHKQKNKR